jgi:hypothetical protein
MDSVVSTKVPKPILAHLRTVAHDHDRTLSGQIRRVLHEWYAEQQRAGAASALPADEPPRGRFVPPRALNGRFLPKAQWPSTATAHGDAAPEAPAAESGAR